MLEACGELDKKGYTIYATSGTAQFLMENGVKAIAVSRPDENKEDIVLHLIADKKFDLVVNIPRDHTTREHTNGYKIRRAAVDHNIPLITNARLAAAFIHAFCTMKLTDIAIKAWDEYK